MKEKLASEGAEVVGNSPAQFGEFLRKETAKWGNVITASDIKTSNCTAATCRQTRIREETIQPGARWRCRARKSSVTRAHSSGATAAVW